MMFTRLGLASMRTQIFLLAVVPIFLLGAFASVHGTFRETASRQRAWVEAEAGKILLVAEQTLVSGSPVEATRVIETAKRLGLTVELTDRRFSREIDPRPPRGIDAALFDRIVGDLVQLADQRLDGDARGAQVVLRIDDSHAIVFHPDFPAASSDFLGIVYVLGLTLLVVLPVLLLSYYLSHRLTRPLIEFAEDAQRISGHENSQELFKADGASEVRSLRDSLNTMQLRIRDMAQRRTTMLRSLGHDLRTPLTRLRMRVERSHEPELRQLLLRDISMLATMIDETMAYLKTTSPGEGAPPKKVDLSSLLQTIASDYADVGVPVVFSGPSRLVCMCEPRNLTRAISNLIDNASRVSGKIELLLGEAEGSIVIDVCDDGPGLSDDLKKQVFEPFFKADTARAASTGSLGLGLSIARSIAYAHGGRLDLIDRAPRGLIARITLLKEPTPCRAG
ncbi:ATP-binding protein [Pleomorphomonas sp. PLEO]|uniref:sensor histidine kinase n=1 Tax=Pleomorphomonas sp. PLEO TaxID=3239306 RepID=UPI00351E5CD7